MRSKKTMSCWTTAGWSTSLTGQDRDAHPSIHRSRAGSGTAETRKMAIIDVHESNQIQVLVFDRNRRGVFGIGVVAQTGDQRRDLRKNRGGIPQGSSHDSQATSGKHAWRARR